MSKYVVLSLTGAVLGAILVYAVAAIYYGIVWDWMYLGWLWVFGDGQLGKVILGAAIGALIGLAFANRPKEKQE